jgi:hypothetical protein
MIEQRLARRVLATAKIMSYEPCFAVSVSHAIAGSEHAAHQPAIDADRGAIDGRGAFAANESDRVADLPWID